MRTKAIALGFTLLLFAGNLFAQDAQHEKELLQKIAELEARIAKLEKTAPAGDAAKEATKPAAETDNTGGQNQEASKEAAPKLSINFLLDGYWGRNFNMPASGRNALRAYDTTNQFTLNQALVVFEREATDKSRFGGRLDLMFGQATESLQGSPANELQPSAFRNVFQAYGTYLVPLGKGLKVDFGKFAGPMGLENVYTKDQINYTRALWHTFFPYYHFGVRANYAPNGKVSATYSAVNGLQQSQDGNYFTSHIVSLAITPSKSFAWNVNYFVGRETRAFKQDFSAPAESMPDGRTHLLDTYLTWNATAKLMLIGELDYGVSRTWRNSEPLHVSGGAFYARYQATPKLAFAGRGEYFSDHGGLFSGTPQILRETTGTAEYKFAEGFLARAEWRRDFSNKPFFPTAVPDLFSKRQTTVTLGLVWWFGDKQGTW